MIFKASNSSLWGVKLCGGGHKLTQLHQGGIANNYEDLAQFLSFLLHKFIDGGMPHH